MKQNCYFRWVGDADEVLLFGSFDEWAKPVPLTKNSDVFGRGVFWEVTIGLEPGRHEFKFKVDGDWKISPDLVFTQDGFGNTNNFIIVTSDEERVASPTYKGAVAGVPSPACMSPKAGAVVGSPSQTPPTLNLDQLQQPKKSWICRQKRSAAKWHTTNPTTSSVNNLAEALQGTSKPVAPSTRDRLLSTQSHEEVESNFKLRQKNLYRSEWELDISSSTENLRSMGGTYNRSKSVTSLSSLANEYMGSHTDVVRKSRVLAKQRSMNIALGAPHAPSTEPTRRASIVDALQDAPRRPEHQKILLQEGKLLLPLVGLPARGKTYIANVIRRHMAWKGHTCELINVGNYRRKKFGSKQSENFFDPKNAVGNKSREEAASQALQDALNALSSDCDIVIYDATNTTVARRAKICKAVSSYNFHHEDIQIMFLEIICDDENIIRSNLRETKLNSPDYKGFTEEDAIEDFLKRIQHYKSVYEPLDTEKEGEYSFMKLIDVGKQIFCNRMQGFIQSQIMSLIANLHITPRPIFLVRHGESVYNAVHRIGGNPPLTAMGWRFATLLGDFFRDLFPTEAERKKVPVWTSTLLRAQQTAQFIDTAHPMLSWRQLDEIGAGICDGMTYAQVAEEMPREYNHRKKDKWNYRWPQGESYQDLFLRLEPVILEVLRQKGPVIIIAHQAVLRVIYGYLTNVHPSECPVISFPQHAVVQLTPKAYGCEEFVFEPLVRQEAQQEPELQSVVE